MLDQMMVLAADQSTRNYQLLEAVSQNIGNANTYGYKPIRFDQYMRPDGNLDMVKRVDPTPGSLFITRRELDIGIEGPGYIQVTRPDGTTAYTRNGSMVRNAQGMLVTPHGDLVGSGIQLPANYHKVYFRKDGTVELVETRGGEPKKIGQVTLVNFPNPEGLKVLGNNLLGETSESGSPALMAEHQAVRQGMLEQSTVNLHYAVEDILRINAGVISNLRVIKAVDEIYREAVQLRQ